MPTKREIIQPKNENINVSKNFNLPHSPGVRAGGFVFLSGMVAIDAETGERAMGTVASETRHILTNMSHMLESAGSSMSKVVKINVLLYDMLEFDNMNRVYREFFPTDPPARTTCGVQLAGGLKVEIECIALA
jgi:2-iminobutanoate/2-iminopropanoate deaminase